MEQHRKKYKGQGKEQDDESAINDFVGTAGKKRRVSKKYGQEKEEREGKGDAEKRRAVMRWNTRTQMKHSKVWRKQILDSE